MTEPRRFYLDRNTDITGASGTGRVADGVVWPDGTVTIRWRGEHQSTVNWDNIDSAERVHGHDGATQFVWLDSDPITTSTDGHEELIAMARRAGQAEAKLQHAVVALKHAPQSCPYHGTEWSGMRRGLPICESCRQPYRVTKVLAAIEGTE